jgi:asparagine synthase (glutamine-hydrolysing)
MCGIAGFTAPRHDARRTLVAMNRALAHRGPDGSGMFVDDEIALGHTRLAIIDLAGGAQPRVDPRTGDALSFNGEIYGYRELAAELRRDGVPLRDNSDTEVLFQLLRRHGVFGAVARIDGMFAFAWRDGATGTLHLVRDRFGEKPLYYALVDGQLLFASEAPALLCHPALRDAGPDRLAAYQLLLFEYLPGDSSGWHGINKLEPGTILSFARGRVTLARYWRPPPIAGAPRVEESEAVDRLERLLRQSIRRRVVADVPVGIFLSGGLDSSLLAALAAEAAPGLKAFSVRVGGTGFDETREAALVAGQIGLAHEIVELGDADLVEACDAIAERLGEPLADSSLLPSYLVCRAARHSMTVALGGDGADELFAGYPNFAVQRFAPAMRFVPPGVGRLVHSAVEALPRHDSYMNWQFLMGQLANGFGAACARQSFLWMAPFGEHSLTRLWRRSALPQGAASVAFTAIDDAATEAAGNSAVEMLLRQFLVTYLPDDILAKTDRASMLNGLELRAPFLDRDFAEYAIGLPTQLKLNGGVRKYILKRVAARYLPAEIVHRRKHGFAVPIGALIRGLLWERCRDVLLSAANPVAAWFERPQIERLLAEHGSGRHDHGKKLWALYMLFAVAGRARTPLASELPVLAAAE